MSQIVPTITAENPHVFREQAERVQSFAERVHIDLMDGVFTPNQSLDTSQVWLLDGLVNDIHLMFQYPQDVLEQLVVLAPALIVIPAEATFDIDEVVELLHANGIKLGIALLAETSVEMVKELLPKIDHLLIFSGNLGYQGGSVANLGLLAKITAAKAINPELEIGWDGGVNNSNVAQLTSAGVDVINVGGSIHAAPDPGLAYHALTALIP